MHALGHDRKPVSGPYVSMIKLLNELPEECAVRKETLLPDVLATRYV